MMTRYASSLVIAIRRVQKLQIFIDLRPNRHQSARTMRVAVIVAFAILSIFMLCEDTYAFPDDGKINATMKDIKEPKDIKEAATASKDVKDAIKAAKEAKKSKKDCARDCGNDYDPVCAHDPVDSSIKTRTFGSQCALDIHNCEMGTKLAVKSKGECPGSGGVRLS